MWRATRSELIRLRRRSFLLGWFGTTALFTAMVTAFLFSAAASGTVIPANAPGGSFPSAAELLGADGHVAPLAAAATVLGVITLSFWALAAASDYSTGLIRLLVQAQPRRWRLLGGKLLALALWTAAATTLAVLVAVGSAPVVARGVGLSPDAWQLTNVSVLVGAWVNTFLALVVWGSIGLVIAVVTRSAGVAIAVGVGYVLVVEGLIGLVATDVASWLPGATLAALSAGGSADVGYRAALGLAVVYAVGAVAVAVLTTTRRDVTD